MDLVIPLGQLRRGDLAVAGGKAANLGELMRAGLPVPDGFCITTEAYSRLVEASGVAARLAALLEGLNVEDSERLARAGAEARELFLQAAMPEEVREAVLEAARPFVGEALAVRSSATAEDLPEASFAGQQDTYLNVIGDEALLDAIRRCWASLWTDRAIAYRQRNGIPQNIVSLAVVVQRMVAADAAGVMFTANPLTGKRTEAAIDASLGLGEAVVSGLVSPDHYVVNKRSLEITSRQIGAKAVQVVGVKGGGTTRVATEGTATEAQAVSDDAIRELVRLGIRIEEHYGWPQDIEWADADGKLYVLQSRPITSLYPSPPPTPEGSLHVYISLNSAQGMLEPFTPMGVSLFINGARSAFYGGRPGPIALMDLGGRLYADATGMIRNPFGRRVLTAIFPEVEPVIGRILSHLLEDPRLTPEEGSPGRSALSFVWRYRGNAFKVARRIVGSIASPEGARRRVDEVIVPRIASIRAELRQPMMPGEQPQVLRRLFRSRLQDVFFNLGPLVAAGIICYKQAEGRVRAWGLDEKLLAAARQGLPYNRTTIMDLDLWALAQRIKADGASREAVATEDPSTLAARYAESSLPQAAQAGMGAFLSKYGHRAIREIDIGVPRWAEDPSYLFGVIQGYMTIEEREAAPDTHFARQMAAAEKSVEELVERARLLPGGWRKARVLGFLLGRFRGLGGLRETPKFMLMWAFQAIRQMMLGAGFELVERGRLDSAYDVFFLRVEELDGVAKHDIDLRALVAERKREYEREMARHRAPRVITSEGEALYGEALATSDGMLSGTGASPGVARGRARVIRNPLGAHLEHGEILVAPSTDPAWTPLFLTAGGLVMEAGGMMSHGSIVAREYGIPAVVGVAEATTRIEDGQTVEIDGNQGLVGVSGVGFQVSGDGEA